MQRWSYASRAVFPFIMAYDWITALCASMATRRSSNVLLGLGRLGSSSTSIGISVGGGDTAAPVDLGLDRPAVAAVLALLVTLDDDLAANAERDARVRSAAGAADDGAALVALFVVTLALDLALVDLVGLGSSTSIASSMSPSIDPPPLLLRFELSKVPPRTGLFINF